LRECENCGARAEANTDTEDANSAAWNAPPSFSSRPRGVLHHPKSVDDVAVFFSVSSHGRMINVWRCRHPNRDNDKPPKRVLQFAPQSKLPLRLALLVDTSGSVHDRSRSKKRAATKFVEKILKSTPISGLSRFCHGSYRNQDFSSDPGSWERGLRSSQAEEGQLCSMRCRLRVGSCRNIPRASELREFW